MSQNFSAEKSPGAVVDYKINWDIILNKSNPVDTITGSSWTTDGTVTIDSDSFSDTQSTVWVSGGTLEDFCKLVNTVTTTGGRTYVASIQLSIQEA